MPPTLSLRTLEISRKEGFAGFEYKWTKCLKHFLGMCTKKELVTDYYDLTDPKVKQQLIDMGFIAKVRETFKP